MPKFGRTSRTNLQQCHPDLQRLFEEVVKHFDCSVICGHRGEAEQNEAYHAGRSGLKFPQSKHNKTPSMAADVAPYYSGEGIPWEDRERFILFAGYVLGVAEQMGLKVVWGGDWDSDRKMKDHTFFDGPHFELVG